MTNDRIWTLVSRKLSGEATAAELAELDGLIKTQANADIYLQAMEEYWKIPTETDEEFLEATYHLHLNRLKTKGFDLEADKTHTENPPVYFEAGDAPKTNRRKRFTIAAAACSIIAAVSFLLFTNQNSSTVSPVEKIAQSEISTKSGSRTKIQLPDGSSVWLNGGSKLVYDNKGFGDKIREVTLTGEGYFDVVKNKEKPFIIHANKITIKVLGTAFNVKAYPGEKSTETSLVRGSIEVSVSNVKEKILMKPNDKLIINNEAVPAVNEVAAGAKSGSVVAASKLISMSHLTIGKDESTVLETSWVDNRLVFEQETFEEVALKMERWYGVSIQITDPKLKLLKLTGSFEKETIADALFALQIKML